MKVVGYGICGPGEASRYMRRTLEEFQRLCDQTIILCNNVSKAEKDLCTEFGFRMVEDNREWGRIQWKIKQDFIEKHVSKLVEKDDILVCLDMDEHFDRHMTREWLTKMPFDAYKVFVVDLWNDEQHYKLDSCFWNTRIWRWTGNTEWVQKPVHCGLVPRWASAYNRYAPFLLIHRGLMFKEDRQRKIKRYEKYDPDAQHLAPVYYEMLTSDTAIPFDEEALHATIAKEVETYKQTKPRSRPPMANEKPRFAYVTNPGGVTVDIPEKQLAETLKRSGFSFVGWADDVEKEMEEMFADDIQTPGVGGSSSSVGYRSTSSEKAEVDALNKRDDIQINRRESRAEAEALPEPEGNPVVQGGLVLRKRLGMKEAEKIRKEKKVK